MIYLISLVVFAGVMFVLVGLLLLVEAKVVQKGDCRIDINEDPEKGLTVSAGITLLGALRANKIFLPSACGGSGSCGTCKCRVTEGGQYILPTELPHLNRRERSENVRLACQVKVKEDMKIRIPDEIFSIQKYHSVVVSNRNVATFIKELVLRLDEGQHLEFKAGAYVQIDIPPYRAEFKDFDVDERFRPTWDRFDMWKFRAGTDQPDSRAYSLASPPGEGEVLKFTIRIATPPPGRPDAPPGIGSSYVFHLKPGDRVTASGPYGDFFVKEAEREICFIGGGAGMAPMRCHILHQLLEVETSRRITFWYGARSRSEMFYDEEFSKLDRRFDHFSYHVALSEPQPEDEWDGLIGFIHQCAHDEYLIRHPDPQDIEYYLCGPPVMIDAVGRMLYSLGVEEEMIAYDKFG